MLQDKRYKVLAAVYPDSMLCPIIVLQNRELQIMKMLNHTNVVLLKENFYDSGEGVDVIVEEML